MRNLFEAAMELFTIVAMFVMTFWGLPLILIGLGYEP